MYIAFLLLFKVNKLTVREAMSLWNQVVCQELSQVKIRPLGIKGYSWFGFLGDHRASFQGVSYLTAFVHKRPCNVSAPFRSPLVLMLTEFPVESSSLPTTRLHK